MTLLEIKEPTSLLEIHEPGNVLEINMGENVSILDIGSFGLQGIQGPPATTTIIPVVTPASVWTLTHNLNQYPSVTIIDSGGTEVEGDVVYTSANVITITFSSAFSGQAYLN